MVRHGCRRDRFRQIVRECIQFIIEHDREDLAFRDAFAERAGLGGYAFVTAVRIAFPQFGILPHQDVSGAVCRIIVLRRFRGMGIAEKDGTANSRLFVRRKSDCSAGMSQRRNGVPPLRPAYGGLLWRDPGQKLDFSRKKAYIVIGIFVLSKDGSIWH